MDDGDERGVYLLLLLMLMLERRSCGGGGRWVVPSFSSVLGVERYYDTGEIHHVSKQHHSITFRLSNRL